MLLSDLQYQGTFSKRLRSTATTYGNSIYIVGGHDDNNGAKNDIVQFNIITNTFNDVQYSWIGDGSFIGRRAHTASLFQDDIYIIGGGQQNGLTFNDVVKFSVKENLLMNVPYYGDFTSRDYHTANVYDSAIYVIGGTYLHWWGWGGGSVWHLNDIKKFDISTRSWTDIPYAGDFSKRGKHTSTLVGNIIYIIGGEGGDGIMNDVLTYDITTATFTTVATYAGSAAHIAEYYAGYIYVFGGGLRDLIRFDISTNTFQTVSYSGIFDNRNSAAADIYLDKMYIFAGATTQTINSVVEVEIRWSMPTLSPTKAPTFAPTYLPGRPTPMPTISPTASPTVNQIVCSLNGGYFCCSLCGSSPCGIILSSAVTYIGNSTSNLTYININFIINKNKGYGVFESCAALVSISIPDTVTDIYDNAFQGSAYTS
jgi:N-acetylneuraminic acid mutarotase